jgi:hypothetical protein
MVPIPPENQQDGLVLDENGNPDFTDLEAEYEVPFESGFDSVIIVDNCPVVKEDDKKGKLMNYIRRTFSAHGTIKDDGIYMPMVKGEDDEPMSQGYGSCGALMADMFSSSLQLQNRHLWLSRRGMDIHWIKDTSCE